MTLRDEVWDEVLDQFQSTSKIKIGELSFDESERHTVRRVLRRMEKLGWVRRETPNSSIWRVGPKYKEILRIQTAAYN